MSNTPRRRQLRLATRTRKRVRRGLMSVTSVLAAAGLLAAGLISGTVTAHADDGEVTISSTPVGIGDYVGPRMVQLAEGGTSFVIGLDAEGTVWGWGLNSSRQVRGNATTATPTPVVVEAVMDFLADNGEEDEHIVQVDATNVTSFALTSEGRIISWGADTTNALGRSAPHTVPGFVQTGVDAELTGITRISGGYGHVLALDESGHVWAWGYNGSGSLGIGSTTNQRYAVQIDEELLSDVTDISAGYNHSLAVSGGAVKAWGYNSGGVLGLGTTTATTTPADVLTTSGMTGEIMQVAAGRVSNTHQSYALDEDGRVWSWGSNTNGALGRVVATATTPANQPHPVLHVGSPITGATQITAGAHSAYALAGDSSVYAWGQNTAGKLGFGNTTNQTSAVKVRNYDLDADLYGSELLGVESIAAGANYLGVIADFGDDEGVVSIAGYRTATGWGVNTDVTVPSLVWRYVTAFDEFPAGLIPREPTPETEGNSIRQTAGAPYDGSYPKPYLTLDSTGTFNYGSPEVPVDLSAETTVHGHPIVYSTSGECPMNATTKLVSINHGNHGVCTVTRSFAGSATLAPLVNEVWQIIPGRALQDIAAVFGEDGEPGELFEGLTEDSDRVALPNQTDAPASRTGVRYSIDPDSSEVCAVVLANGNPAGNSTAQRYLAVLGAGDCVLTATHTAGVQYYYAPMDKTVTIPIGAGPAVQALDLSGLNGLRYSEDSGGNPATTQILPDETDIGEQPTTYVSTTPEICEVSGLGDRTLTALAAGDCVLGVSAPALSASGGDPGFLAYSDIKTVTIGRGIQTLPVTTDMVAILESLQASTEKSDDLPEATRQGELLTWGADSASVDFPDACAIKTGDGATYVRAGDDIDEPIDGAYATCEITATAPQTDNWEAFEYTITVEISDRGFQTLDLSVLASGQVVGDTVVLPGETVEEQPVTYASASPDDCAIVDNQVTFLTGNPCSITATAPGQVSSDGTPLRPFATVVSPNVAKLNQTTSRPMPDFGGLKVGYQSGLLPTETNAEQTLSNWAAGPADACEISDGRVVLLSDEPCTVTASADATDTHLPFAYSFTFQADINYEALDEEIAAAILDIEDGTYTADSWAAYQAALTAARAKQFPNGGSQADVDEALAALQEARAALVDLTGLRTVYAGRVTDAESYTSDSWEDYQEAVTAAEAVLADPEATAEEVEAAIEALGEAAHELVDLTELRAVYADRVTDAESYTPDSWLVYQAAVEAAEAVLADPEATAEEVEAAIEALGEAVNDLVLRADFTELEAAVDLTEALPPSGTGPGEYDYSAPPALADAYEKLQDALADALAVLDDKNSTQEEIDDARDALQFALGVLQSAMALADAVAGFEEEALNEDDFTPESWADYQDALAAARALLEVVPVDQEALEAALLALQEARGGLVYKDQVVEGLAEAIDGHAVGDAPITLPTVTDRGAEVTYAVDPASAGVCELVDGKLVIIGVGTCTVNWTAPAIGNFPASSGSVSVSTGPGLQLVFEGVQISDGAELDAGQTLTARGEGLRPGSILTVELHSDPVTLGTAVVGLDGTAAVTFTIPPDTAPGHHTLVAFGISDIDGSTLTRTASVSITNLPQTGAEIAPLVAGALLLLLAGAGVLLGTRRRRVGPVVE